MNKFFIIALFAFIAVAAAAPAELELKPEADYVAAEGKDQDKRSIYYRTTAGYRYLPGYDYPSIRYGYPTMPSLNYPGISPLTYPYYSRFLF